MNGLNPELVAIIRNEKKGAWLRKFDESVEVINTSAAQDTWVLRGSVKADSGFYQGTGICIPYSSSYMGTGKMITNTYGTFEEQIPNPDHEPQFALHMCLAYGHPTHTNVDYLVNRLETWKSDRTEKLIRGKHSVKFIKAWVALCEEKRIICAALTEARPKPVITDIGLSPRVTATLVDMDLRVDLPTIKMAEIKYRLVPKRYADSKSPDFGKIMMSRDGSYALLEKAYYVAWTPGTKHMVTRFSGLNCNCEACGKSIPSGRFVQHSWLTCLALRRSVRTFSCLRQPQPTHKGLASSNEPWQLCCHSKMASKSSIFPGKAVLQLALKSVILTSTSP